MYSSYQCYVCEAKKSGAGWFRKPSSSVGKSKGPKISIRLVEKSLTLQSHQERCAICKEKQTILQSSPTILNPEGTGQKIWDGAIFEIAWLRDSVITPGENSR